MFVVKSTHLCRVRVVWYSQRPCLYNYERSLGKEKTVDTLNCLTDVGEKTSTVNNE